MAYAGARRVDVLKRFREHEYRLLLLAWSRLREERRRGQDRVGRYVVAEKDRKVSRDPTG